MKITYKIPLYIVTAITVLCGCNKEEVSDVFSKQGALADIQEIEHAGTTLSNEVEELTKVPFATLGNELVQFMTYSVSGPQNIVYSIARLGETMSEGQPVQNQFEQLMALTTIMGMDICLLWDKGYGTWEWNTDAGDFEYSSSLPEEIVLKFPSTSGMSGNNVQLRLYGFEFYDGDFPGKGEQLDDGSYRDKMVKKLFFEMKADGQLIASSNIIIDFSETGNIDFMNLIFNPIPYSFQTEKSNTNNQAGWRYTLLSDTNIVFEQLLSTETNEWVGDEKTIKQMTSSAQIMDIVIVGEINTESLLKDVYTAEIMSPDDESYTQLLAGACNNNAQYSIRYTDNTIIATGKAIAVHSSDSEPDIWIVDILFTFSDGSAYTATDLFNRMYSFENEMDLVLSKTQNSFN